MKVNVGQNRYENDGYRLDAITIQDTLDEKFAAFVVYTDLRTMQLSVWQHIFPVENPSLDFIHSTFVDESLKPFFTCIIDPIEVGLPEIDFQMKEKGLFVVNIMSKRLGREVNYSTRDDDMDERITILKIA